MIIAVAANLAFLGAYKYLDFFLSALSPLFGSSVMSVGLAAPVGISFFTFRCISYIVDVYRAPETGTRSFPRLLLYIAFFPQLMAGPIERFGSFSAQLRGRRADARAMAEGLRRFIIGLAKKLLIAAVLGKAADAAFSASAPDIRMAWLGAAAYMLQIYFDFSAYSDMAIGLARAFGFSSPENFDRPYISASVGEFWRRWHMSLSSWFRDYLYIPLGGNRRGRTGTALNKFIVFALCGLWHGAAWTFILWGAWHGLLSALESLSGCAERLGKSRAGRVLGHVYTLLAVCLGFVMFRAQDVSAGLSFIGAMFTGFDISAAGTAALRGVLTGEAVFTLIIAALGAVLPLRELWARA